jgi:hypothetical protein
VSLICDFLVLHVSFSGRYSGCEPTWAVSWCAWISDEIYRRIVCPR